MDHQNKSPNKSSLKRLLVLSILGHAVLLSLLWYDFRHDLTPFGDGTPSFVAVSLISGSNVTPANAGVQIPSQKLDSGFRRNDEPSTTATGASNSNGTGTNAGTLSGNSVVLSTIQNKIERAKYYPIVAKRQSIEGAPVVEFKIGSDGSVEYVRLKQTSGSALLDEAAQKTVQKAAPFPRYPDPIALSIHYALGEKIR